MKKILTLLIAAASITCALGGELEQIERDQLAALEKIEKHLRHPSRTTE
jgi:hypothetical protein